MILGNIEEEKDEKSVPEELSHNYETKDLSEPTRKPSARATQKTDKPNKLQQEEFKIWEKACQDYGRTNKQNQWQKSEKCIQELWNRRT